IEALPYWDYSKDTNTGEYYGDEENGIFTDRFFGNYSGNEEENHAVTDGLFAYWPIVEWTQQDFGAGSDLNVMCTNAEWFNGTASRICSECCGKGDDCECSDDDTYPQWLRDHDDCTPYMARNPYEESAYDGTYDLLGTQDDFDACSDPRYIKEWMDWQNCVNFEPLSCILQLETGLTCDEALNVTCPEVLQCNLTGFYFDENDVKQTPHCLHGDGHLQIGRDIKDVSTSPTDVGVFTGYHSNIDRNNFHWMMNVVDDAALQENNYYFPASPNDPTQRAIHTETNYFSGPFGSAGNLVCGTDSDHYDEYTVGESMWYNGTQLEDVNNEGFPFDDLFDAPPANGWGYTQEEILYYTHPSRTPYTYDTLESNYY
ncbi:MAG: hypothetical protein SGILL_008546, partial [Bacillariaceae sp.]